jgi:hypothetical protein
VSFGDAVFLCFRSQGYFGSHPNDCEKYLSHILDIQIDGTEDWTKTREETTENREDKGTDASTNSFGDG